MPRIVDAIRTHSVTLFISCISPHTGHSCGLSSCVHYHKYAVSFSKSRSTSDTKIISVLGVASALFPSVGKAKSHGVNTPDWAY